MNVGEKGEVASNRINNGHFLLTTSDSFSFFSTLQLQKQCPSDVNAVKPLKRLILLLATPPPAPASTDETVILHRYRHHHLP